MRPLRARSSATREAAVVTWMDGCSWHDRNTLRQLGAVELSQSDSEAEEGAAHLASAAHMIGGVVAPDLAAVGSELDEARGRARGPKDGQHPSHTGSDTIKNGLGRSPGGAGSRGGLGGHSSTQAASQADGPAQDTPDV